MTGTWVNTGAIALGALLGCLFRRGIPERINQAIMRAEGLAILIIALNGVIAAMFTDSGDGTLADSDGLLLLVSLVLGCLAGELLRLEDRFQAAGNWVERRLGGAEGFSRGLVTASLLFCVGAMAIVGPLNDGLSGDSSILYIKSTLDFTTAIILASALGIGVLFSAVPTLVLQGSIALLAVRIAPYVSDRLLNLICMVGYAIVLSIGLNFLLDAKIRTANLLPALVVPVLYHFLLERPLGLPG